MLQYRIQEADFKIPKEWHDQSINIFKMPAVEGAGDASFVISRDSISADINFADYVAEQLSGAERQLPGFQLIQTWDFELNGYPASLADYVWEREGRSLMLRQVFVEHASKILVTTLTTTSSDLPRHEVAWKKTMHSLTLRSASAESA